ncbi:MAG: hydroxyacid dehydrogenase [Candidatus Levybacteria bacterium]|nr:hydroxyacid dehydrogenase [Candidatus Levybacteria bacterium]
MTRLFVKIAFFEIEGWEKPLIEEKLGSYTLLFEQHALSPEVIVQYRDIDILSSRSYPNLTEELLKQFTNLKLVSTRTTGFDHIDLAYCRKNNIIVCNVPDYGSYTVAEHTLALMLAISRQLIQSVERTKKGDFRLKGLRGFELYGKTLGVVGTGSIGRSVIRLARCFGMEVLAFSRHTDAALAKKLGFTYVDLDTLLAKSDIVSLHVPYNKETHHLINKNNIMKCKKGSILINTARGGVVDTEAILKGLDTGILFAAGLDVLEEECYIRDEVQLLTEEFLKECNLKTQLLNHVLLTKPNVIITPHNAFNSTEALQRIVNITIENITAFLSHRPQNTV